MMDIFHKLYHQSIMSSISVGLGNKSKPNGRALIDRCRYDTILDRRCYLQPFHFQNCNTIILKHPNIISCWTLSPKRQALSSNSRALSRNNTKTYKCIIRAFQNIQIFKNRTNSRKVMWILDRLKKPPFFLTDIRGFSVDIRSDDDIYIYYAHTSRAPRR